MNSILLVLGGGHLLPPCAQFWPNKWLFLSSALSMAPSAIKNINKLRIYLPALKDVPLQGCIYINNDTLHLFKILKIIFLEL